MSLNGIFTVAIMSSCVRSASQHSIWTKSCCMHLGMAAPPSMSAGSITAMMASSSQIGRSVSSMVLLCQLCMPVLTTTKGSLVPVMSIAGHIPSKSLMCKYFRDGTCQWDDPTRLVASLNSTYAGPFSISASTVELTTFLGVLGFAGVLLPSEVLSFESAGAESHAGSVSICRTSSLSSDPGGGCGLGGRVPSTVDSDVCVSSSGASLPVDSDSADEKR
mmetsp:Transcript_56942/g.101667  ORF Transcript_56942/g.101667 Transcript_56942/m.101667 type:complete len:219 (+) Transcript_56942:2444-3100(+)